MNQNSLKNLGKIRHVALDMDGTIYSGRTLFPYTPAALEKFEMCNIGYTYLTNNSSLSIEAYLEKLHRLGLKAGRDQIYSSSLATIEYLQDHHPKAKRIFVLGTESLRGEFEQARYTVIREKDSLEPELVVVGFDTTLTYERLCKAAWWIQQGKPFIATHPDRVCPTDDPTVLVDCGSVCAALIVATGMQPHVVLGKPDPCMLKGILKRYSLRAEELAMVGDRLYTDMAMAVSTGVIGILVLSGETKPKDISLDKRDKLVVVNHILEFAELLAESKKGSSETAGLGKLQRF